MHTKHVSLGSSPKTVVPGLIQKTRYTRFSDDFAFENQKRSSRRCLSTLADVEEKESQK